MKISLTSSETFEDFFRLVAQDLLFPVLIYVLLLICCTNKIK